MLGGAGTLLRSSWAPGANLPAWGALCFTLLRCTFRDDVFLLSQNQGREEKSGPQPLPSPHS